MAATSIPRSDVEATIEAMKAAGVSQFKGLELDLELEHEVHTDKTMVKLVPCRTCARPLVVTTFFAPAKAECRVCAGEDPNSKIASVGVPEPGSTPPEKAIDLTKCLINHEEFEFMSCPFGHGEMEIKSIHHNSNYGPMELAGYKNGRPEYRQTAKGETVMYQCNTCLCVQTLSTTAVTQFRRVNEVKQGKNVNGWADQLGIREGDEIVQAPVPDPEEVTT